MTEIGTGRVDAPTLLLVDDDAVLRERLARAFRERGFEVSTAANGVEAIARAREDAPEYAVIDLRMPEPSGIEVLRAILALDPATRAVVLTGYGSIATAVEATKLGAVGYLPKPADADENPGSLRRAAGARVARHRDAVPGAHRVGAHPAGAVRLRGKRVGGGATPPDPPPLAAAEAAEDAPAAVGQGETRQRAACFGT